MVEIGWLTRFPVMVADQSVGGVEWIGRSDARSLGRDPTISGQYVLASYGWPVRNWGTLFREENATYWNGFRIMVPIIGAINLGNTYDTTMIPPPPTTPGSVTTATPPARFPSYDPCARYLPVFPLLGHSLMAAVIWGLPLYVALWWRNRRTPGACVQCGYDRRGLSETHTCPECGSVGREARDAVMPS